MNIEIANKLVKLRKQAGLSQEELADKLGLSRQAVSKWERAEASPDTDNLICLAKLYAVSLDELLSTEDDPETIIREQVKRDDEPEKNKESVHIGEDGVHIVDDEGEKVTINDNGIHIVDENGKEVHVGDHHKKERGVYWAVSGILYVVATVAYLLFGFLLNMWNSMWILFFVPDIIMSFAKSIYRRRPHHFNITFLALFSFFLVCWVLFPEKQLWHPMWSVFLAIPLYYICVNRIEALIDHQKEKDDKNVIDDKEDE